MEIKLYSDVLEASCSFDCLTGTNGLHCGVVLTVCVSKVSEWAPRAGYENRSCARLERREGPRSPSVSMMGVIVKA